MRPTKNQIAAAGAIAVAFAAGVGVGNGSPDEAPEAPIVAKPGATELATQDAHPGVPIVARISIPRGTRIKGNVEIIGDAAGKFAVTGLWYDDYSDATVANIIAVNTSFVTLPFRAAVEWGPE